MIKKTLSLLLVCILFSSSAKAVDYETPILYTGMLMVADFALLIALDEADNGISSSNFTNTWKHPRPLEDDDDYLYNYVLHPLMGSETYLRAREADFSIPGSIAFSMGASLVWEYLVESWTEHPSTQDLVLTTGIGWLLGELRYNIKKNLIKKNKNYFWVDPIWTTLEYFDFRITKKGSNVRAEMAFSIPL